MEKINAQKAFMLTSPNPLILVCTLKEDGSLNMAPVSFFMFASFTPPVVAFAMGMKKNSGDNFRRTGRAVLVTPGTSISAETFKYGTKSGSAVDKISEWPIELMELPGCDIKVPKDIRGAFVVNLDKVVETGDHYLYTCNVEEFYGDENTDALYAWKGYAELAGAEKK